MDHFQQRFENAPGFSIILMSMEAVVPRPKAEAKEKNGTDAPEKNNPQTTQTVSAEKNYMRTWWEAEQAKKATRKAAILWGGLLLALIFILYFRA